MLFHTYLTRRHRGFIKYSVDVSDSIMFNIKSSLSKKKNPIDNELFSGVKPQKQNDQSKSYTKCL